MIRYCGLTAVIAGAIGVLICWNGLAEPPDLKKTGIGAPPEQIGAQLKKLVPTEEPPAKEPPQNRPDDNNPLPPLEKFKQQLPMEGPPNRPLDSATGQEDPTVIIARVAENMGKSEDRLKIGNTDKDTQSVQKKIIDDLDKLINQQQKNQESKDKSQNQKKSSSQDQKNKDTTKSEDKKPKPNPSDKEPKQSTKKDNEKTDKTTSAQPKNGKDADKTADVTIANLVKDIWGHLPKNKRQEMDAYSHEKFMPQYEQLLRQYYQNIAAQKKNKGGN